MAITSVIRLADVGGKTAGTTLSSSTGTTVSPGEICFVAVASDNLGTVTGPTYEHIKVNFINGEVNPFTKICEYSNARGAAAGGVTVSLWYCQATTTISSANSNNSIQVTFASSIAAKVFQSFKFNVGAGKMLRLVEASTLGVTASPGPGSMTSSTLPNKEYLCIRVIGCEDAQTALSAGETNWSSFNGMTGTTGASAATNMRLWPQYIIQTTSLVTSTGGGTWNSADMASILAIFEEVSFDTNDSGYMF